VIRTEAGVKRHKELYCEQCEVCSSERTSFRNHMGVFHAIRCALCDAIFKSDLELEQHVEMLSLFFCCKYQRKSGAP
jgi:hypothetical protein